MKNIKALGVMGGTFDPIHYGHLIAAQYCRHEFSLDKILFLPSGQPPHKEAAEVSAYRHRYRMVQLAIQDNPAFLLSSLEISRPGYSYTVDSIPNLASEYPGALLYFIMGADSLLTMDTWKDYQRLISLCKFIVVNRPGYSVDRKHRRLLELPPALWDNLYQLEMPGIDISSSEIRERVSQGKPIKYLLPGSVEEYILIHNLYKQGRNDGC